MILSYCLNVHPAESVEELLAVLRGPVARVRAAWRGEAPMGVGLWLPRAVAEPIANDPAVAEQVRSVLAGERLFAYTANAFPIGGFHAAEVKEQVYRPTWLEPARRDYTLLAFRALAALLPDGARGSVSTVPVSYKAFGHAARAAEAGEQLGLLVADLLGLEASSGHELSLALEPEPLALLETTAEAIAFLTEHVFAGSGQAALRERAGLDAAASEAALRRCVGVCVDTCHLACEFEDLPDSLAQLSRAGVRVVKAQLSSAIELRDPATNAEGRARLRAFVEPRYLHQSLALDGGVVVRANDLSDLFDADGQLVSRFANASRIRTHFHVPVAWPGDEHLGSTRADLQAALPHLVAATDHLEVETYTFDVLPPADRARYRDDVAAMVVDELRWVEQALA